MTRIEGDGGPNAKKEVRRGRSFQIWGQAGSSRDGATRDPGGKRGNNGVLR